MYARLIYLQASVVEQAKAASEHVEEANRLRSSAIQEAAFYRAKLAALEASSEGEVVRIEKTRIAELEQQLSTTMAEQGGRDRKIQELSESLSLQTTLLEQAEARAEDASKRADTLTESFGRDDEDQSALREQYAEMEATLRDQANRLLAQTSLIEQQEADNMRAQSQVDELMQSREQHVRALDQTRTALQAVTKRADEVDEQYQRAREQITQLEADLAELRGELEARTTEVDNSRVRLADVENSWAKSREEADAFRAVTTGSLGKLLDSHRDLKSDEDRMARGHAEKVTALEGEINSMRDLIKDSGRRADETQVQLLQERKKVRDVQADAMSLRSQIVGLRAQLSNALADSGRVHKELAFKDSELRDKTKEASSALVRLDMLRNFLAENGFEFEGDDLPSKINGASSRIIALEDQLAERVRLHQRAERELQILSQQKQELEMQHDTMSAELDQLRATRSPTRRNGVNHVSEQRALEAEQRADEAERKLEENDQLHKARLSQLEEDYQLAVHYVK